MKIFVGQKVTGENSEKLKKFSNKIIKALEKKGHSVYCNLFGKGLMKGLQKSRWRMLLER